MKKEKNIQYFKEEKQIKYLLHNIYYAGFVHGLNEGTSDGLPKHGTLMACNRLLNGESPLLDGTSYDIKDMVAELVERVLQPTKTTPSLLAKILFRKTAVKRDDKGFITLNEKDVIDWFENGDHLREFHETDLM